MKITGLGKGIPERRVTNDELSRFIDTTDEWIFTRTGIKSRYVCTNETLTDIASAAAVQAVENAGLTVSGVDMIICTTIGGDYETPALANCVAERIGVRCPVFDINIACAGFIYALEIADGFIAAKKAKNILIVSAEIMSSKLDWSDRNTCVLFGDGAAACVVSDGDSFKYINLSSFAPPNIEVLNMPNGTGNNPFIDANKPTGFVTMQGKEIFKFAVKIVESEIKLMQEKTGLTPDRIDKFLLHQANKRIIDLVQTKLKQPEEKFPCNLEHYGNTSSATIPLLLFETVETGQIKSGDTLLLTAFGGGLASGTCVMVWQ